eukprot:scaffold92617_cov21-Tisochrysis_lutea.AAC.1
MLCNAILSLLTYEVLSPMSMLLPSKAKGSGWSFPLSTKELFTSARQLAPCNSTECRAAHTHSSSHHCGLAGAQLAHITGNYTNPGHCPPTFAWSENRSGATKQGWFLLRAGLLALAGASKWSYAPGIGRQSGSGTPASVASVFHASQLLMQTCVCIICVCLHQSGSPASIAL